MTRAYPIVLLVLLSASLSRGQPPAADGTQLRGQSDQTKKRLVEADRKIAAGKAADAIEDLFRVVDESGDDLVSFDGKHFRPARRVAQLVISKLPADVLRGYRDRADGPAGVLFKAGQSTRDPKPLVQLVDRYYVSRWTDDALLLLGEFAFERGDFRSAETNWRRLFPSTDPAGDPAPLDPPADPAAVRARIVLAILFQGEPRRARDEFERFATEFPKATGRLAGSDGSYTTTLRKLLDRPPVVPADATDADRWATFAGTSARTGQTGGLLPAYWTSRPTWTTAIPHDPTVPRTTFPRPTGPKGVGFHPVVVGGIAYLADPVRVFGFDLATGAVRFTYDLRDEVGMGQMPVKVALPFASDADFTLTAAGDRLIARLGRPAVAPPTGEIPEKLAPPTNYLIGYGPPEPPRVGGPLLAVHWKLPPPVSSAAWEGAPAIVDGRLYAAFDRFEGNRTIHALACYDDPPAKPLWVTDISDGPLPSNGDSRTRHELVTVADGRVLFCTHTGVIAALDARTGKHAWAMRYPRAARPPVAGAHRDLAPPVVADGRAFVAPTDSDSVYALDLDTGRPLWQSGAIPVDQLLGVTRGRLIVTLTAPNRGIRGLNVATGSDRQPDGWAIHDDPLLASYGRGLVAHNLIAWPTKSGVFLLNPLDGTQLRPPLSGPHGNLAYADGVLLAATATELWGYVNPQRELAATDPRVRANAAEEKLTRGALDAARALLRNEVSNAPPDWAARAAARLLSLEPPERSPTAVQAFRTKLNLTPAIEASWIRQTDGVPIRLDQLIAQHFQQSNASLGVVASPSPRVEPTIATVELDSRRVRTVSFPSPRFVPLLPFADSAVPPGLMLPEPRLVVSDGVRLLAYRPADETPFWQVDLPTGLNVTHGTTFADGLIAAGPDGAVRWNWAEPSPIWLFRLPATDPLPTAPLVRPLSEGMPQTLADFHLAGSRLIARVGEHHLLALDGFTGRVAWVLDAVGRARLDPLPFPDAPRFTPHFLALPTGIVVQTSAGRRWQIEPADGRVVLDTPSSLTPWESPPASLTSRRVVVADGPGLVRGLRLVPRVVDWFAESGWGASLAGRSPQLRALDSSTLVAIRRNHGVELDRLRDSGSREWKRTPLLSEPLDLTAAAIDATHAYLPSDDKLTAVRIADGTIAWAVDLDPAQAPWRAQVIRGAVVVFPAVPPAIEPWDPIAIARAFARFPQLGRLPAIALAAYDAAAARTVPLLAFAADTGRLVHRLDLPAVGPVAVVHLGPTAVVATAGAAHWLK